MKHDLMTLAFIHDTVTHAEKRVAVRSSRV